MKKSLKQRFWEKVKKNPGRCWIWKGAKTPQGYGSVRVFGKARGAHTIALYLTTGHLSEHPEFVCHHCDNRKCVNPSHLFLGNARKNWDDAFAKGRLKLYAGSKLSLKDRKDIRKQLSQGAKQYEIARQFGVHPNTIHYLKVRRTWREDN